MFFSQVGIDDEEYQNFSCLCFIKMGSLHARVKTPISGFIPGQTIEVTVSFYNDSSSVEVTKIKVALEKVSIFIFKILYIFIVLEFKNRSNFYFFKDF